MKYLMTIIRYEENKDYEAEMAKWKENDEGYMRGRFVHNTSLPEPKREIPGRSLEVHLTEDEFKKIKENVIKIFE